MSYAAAGPTGQQFYYNVALQQDLIALYKARPDALQKVPAGAYITSVSPYGVTYQMSDPRAVEERVVRASLAHEDRSQTHRKGPRAGEKEVEV